MGRNAEGEVEMEMRIVIALASTVDLDSRGKTKRCPSRKRADVMAKGARQGKLRNPKELTRMWPGQGAQWARKSSPFVTML